ncbi:hypothetical protein [Cellulomonas aerilata]|uniref:hypothetical protein n=1 Tax=Cellulomonas aerilata TaxID=515326 RepID=UPI0011BD8537|nr:hypothetical protein [Cellulomonas aerilata]
MTPRVRSVAPVAAVVLALLLAGCGGADPTPVALGGPPETGSPATASSTQAARPPQTTAPEDLTAEDLLGLWGAGEDGGAEIVLELDADGTFTRVSLLREEREGGTFRFQDVVEGTFRVGDGRLTLRPTAGTQTVDDPESGDGPVSTRKADLDREQHGVELREGGAVLVLTPADGAPLLLARQQS